MQISGLGVNPLLSLGARSSNATAQGFALQNSPANSAANSAKTLPPVQPIALSMDMLLSLQGQQEEEAKDAVEELKAPTAEELFLQEARKSPMERLREQVMKELGITDDALAQMTPEERRAAEDKIREMIEEKLKQGTRDGEAPADTAGDMVLEAALG